MSKQIWAPTLYRPCDPSSEAVPLVQLPEGPVLVCAGVERAEPWLRWHHVVHLRWPPVHPDWLLFTDMNCESSQSCLPSVDTGHLWLCVLLSCMHHFDCTSFAAFEPLLRSLLPVGLLLDVSILSCTFGEGLGLDRGLWNRFLVTGVCELLPPP
jgi:hypothetical protein